MEGKMENKDLNRYMQIAQDTKKEFHYNKDNEAWFWNEGYSFEAVYYGPFAEFHEALLDAIGPYLQESGD
jgi:hypothetical protein